MNLDDALLVMVITGFGVAIAYVRAEYVHWREQGVSERRRENALRDLHAARLSHHSTALSTVPGGAARRASTRSGPRVHPFTERRRRPRQQAAQ